MAPVTQDLEKRQYGYGYGNYCGYGYYYDYDGGCVYSGWNTWGRWVLLAAILVGVFFIYLLFSCLTARRRRKRGMTPYRGTAWAAGNNWGNQNQHQQNTGYYNSQAPGPYNNNPPPAYGGQQYGVAEPQPTYGANRDIHMGHYAPPAGPPPGKGEQIVR